MPNQPTVTTTDGGVVHIACADGEAQAMWRQRRRQALIDLALLAACYMLLALAHVPISGSMAIGIVGFVAHILRHQHWWRIVFHSVHRRLSRYLRPK